MGAFAAEMSFSRAKVVLAGKNLLSREEITGQLGEALGPQIKDKWFKTTHRLYRRPDTALQEDPAGLKLHVPQANRFIPENFNTLVSQADSKKKNDAPKRVELITGDDRADLFVLVDHVYLKPKTRLDLALNIAPSSEQATAFLASPADRGVFNAVIACISEKINKEVGYEASMAHFEFFVKKLDDTGLHLSVEAFSDKILPFTASLIEIIIACATDGGIENSLVANSLERQHRKFKNFNLDVIVRCNNNRLQFLMPDHFHPCQMQRALKDSWLKYSADGEAAAN